LNENVVQYFSLVFQSKNLKIRICTAIILPVVLYGVKLGFLLEENTDPG